MKLSAIERFTILDYPEKVACIAFTPGCNMRCGFCHNPEFVLPEKIQELQGSFIEEETFFNFLEKRRGLLDGVVVSGGEPTIWRDLPAFLAGIKKRGFLVKLDTNGNHPEMLRSLLEKNLVDYVAMDVKTSLAQYKDLVGGAVKPENIFESIHLLKASPLPYEFRTTLIKEVHTKEVLEDMKGLLSGSRQWFLQTFRPGTTLHPTFATYHPFSSEEMEAMKKEFSSVVERAILRS
jgi:pyruvate formate lyase activating enzyme